MGGLDYEVRGHSNNECDAGFWFSAYNKDEDDFSLQESCTTAGDKNFAFIKGCRAGAMAVANWHWSKAGSELPTQFLPVEQVIKRFEHRLTAFRKSQDYHDCCGSNKDAGFCKEPSWGLARGWVKGGKVVGAKLRCLYERVVDKNWNVRTSWHEATITTVNEATVGVEFDSPVPTFAFSEMKLQKTTVTTATININECKMAAGTEVKCPRKGNSNPKHQYLDATVISTKSDLGGFTMKVKYKSDNMEIEEIPSRCFLKAN